LVQNSGHYLAQLLLTYQNVWRQKMFNELGDLIIRESYILPRQSCSICYWGGGDSPDMSASIAASQSAADRSAGALQDYYTEASAYLAPWRNAGGAAVNQISGLLNLPGYTALDPTKTLEGTPGYQFLRDQGTEALRRYGAGTGLLSSGAGMKGALDYGQKLASTYAWAPYMSSLQNLSGQGLGAAGTSGGYAMQAGTGTANVYSTAGQQQAQLLQQQAIMDAQNQNSWMNDLMSGLGFGASLIAAPFTGGTSLAGALGTGAKWLGGALGGGGGGGGGSLYGTSNAYGSSTPMWDTGMFKASGGPTAANRPYIVGERGPELFVPNVPGYVVPNEYTRYSAFARPNQQYRMTA
jgi:hypothetical protein